KETKDTSEILKPTIPYELMARYTVTNNEEILSFYIDYYQFSVGAHGITTRNTYNIDTKTGNKLMLKDFFTEGYDHKTYINSALSKEINKHPEYYFTG
ncbi:PdaC/SigV domain-containing protein, partial [Clostridium sp. HCS.1]|uniref:PdaC/SigV domain-containing protein n=1 Tax=Clostridium sp. HCS.1 TaxID=3238594 RepID=UPI003A0FBECF